ncbi:MAG: PilZ domain-containing protein [Pirellulaceae bacterium]
MPCKVQLTRELLDDLKLTGPLPTIEGDRRRFVRFRVRARGILYYRQTLPAIERAEGSHLVLVRNISRSGIGFLSAEQLFPHERFSLWVEGKRRMEIEIARCRRLHDGCYDIGARFCTPLEA